MLVQVTQQYWEVTPPEKVRECSPASSQGPHSELPYIPPIISHWCPSIPARSPMLPCSVPPTPAKNLDVSRST